MPKIPYKIGITAFLITTSLLMVGGLLIVCFGSVSTMSAIGEKTRSVRISKLPHVYDIQHSLLNIESLRRLTEIVYRSSDPQVRRSSRLRAQALASETAISPSNEVFSSESQQLIKQLNELASIRDSIFTTRLEMDNLRRPLMTSLIELDNLTKKQNLNWQLRNSGLNLSIFSRMSEDISQASRLAWAKSQKTDALFFSKLNNFCSRQKQKEILAECGKIKTIAKSYSQLSIVYKENTESAYESWQDLDQSLQEVRDLVSNDAEYKIIDALSSVEQSSNSAISNVIWLTSGEVILFFGWFCLLLLFIVRPIRWVGRNLIEIQNNLSKTPPPPIYIQELYQVGDLLDRFGEHFTELTSHALTLEEDASLKKELEELMKAVFKVSVDGYIIWSPEERYLVGDGFLPILGYSSLEELSEKWESIGFSSGTTLSALYKRITREGFTQREMSIKSKSGELIPFHVSELPFKRRDGISIFSYFRDLREQKKIEEKLLIAKENAEQAAKVKSEFLARMSHEIRTPMNGVLGLTDIALKKSPPPEQKLYLEKIHASARILLGVINDILDFSKLESGGLSLERRPFAFARLLETGKDLFSFQAEQRGLFFTIDASPDIPEWLMGDELRLSQVLLNLCGNAMKFTQKGGVTVKVEIADRIGQELQLRFSVIDTGIGITKQQLKNLFKPFTQADATTTRKYGGTGLGLVISDLLVKLMHGNISVESVPGKGSTFSFTITIDVADPQDVQLENNGSSLPEEREVLKGLRVLLAEDNEINQEVAIAVLEELGCTVTLAVNGVEAIELLSVTPVDCVLMDIQMPTMDGLTATKKIREKTEMSFCNIPIIAMTAHAMKEDREKSFDAGMNGHITKPLDPEELTTILLAVKDDKIKNIKENSLLPIIDVQENTKDELSS